MREVHFVEDKEMRYVRVLRLRGPLNEVEGGAGDVACGVESVWITENVVVARPVRAHGNHRVGGWLAFIGGGCEPTGERLRELGFTRSGKTAEDEKALCGERGDKAQQQRATEAQADLCTVR